MSEGKYVSVKIDKEVLETCRIASAFLGVTLADYISERLRPIAHQDMVKSYVQWSKKNQDKLEKENKI